MKTTKELKSEMKEVLEAMEFQKKKDDKKSANAIKRLKAKLDYLKMCLLYIESNPSVEFIIKEKERLTNRINAFMELYKVPEDWGKTMKSNHRKAYEKDMGIPKLRKQLSTIHFILK